MTQLVSARKGVITPETARLALRENVSPEFIPADVVLKSASAPGESTP